MDTYGDLVTLLLCFFVLLFAMSTIDAVKWAQIVTSFSEMPVIDVVPMNPQFIMQDAVERIPTSEPLKTPQDATPNQPDSTAPDPTINEEDPHSIFHILQQNMQDFLDTNELDAMMIVDEANLEITIRFNDNVFFNPGDADLLPGSDELLDMMIEAFVQNLDYVQLIRIEGHTDPVPIHSYRFPSNWELSAARAGSALQYIVSADRIDPAKLNLGGYGEYHPVADNDTTEGRALNRRVDFVMQAKKGDVTP
jgi:chemotaxis protein MotB